MKQNLKIKSVHAREILDSRGNPTVEVDILVEGGFLGRATVPSGASTGSFEAIELRDNDNSRYLGKGVLNAVSKINDIIANKIIGMNVLDQVKIDTVLINLDGTTNKGVLGANSTLGVSLAVARAASNALGINLYNYLGGVNSKTLPVPMMNILNGGKHSDNNINIQEFMIMPVGATNFPDCIRMCTEVFHNLKIILNSKGLSTSVGDEGGFAPNLSKDEEALEVIVEAIIKAGYIPEKDFKIALDIAATEMYEEAKKIGKDGLYYFWKTEQLYTTEDLINYYIYLINKYPIISIEDGLSENDFEGFAKLTKDIGNTIQIVGDDLFVTNTKRLSNGINLKSANSILIKLNQIGTLTETLDTIEMAHRAGYTTIISHRSGETEDTTIADLAVGLNCGQIKTGAPSRTDRVCKYNQLLRINEELEFSAKFLGSDSFYNLN